MFIELDTSKEYAVWFIHIVYLRHSHVNVTCFHLFGIGQLLFHVLIVLWGLPWWFNRKKPTCQCRRHGFSLWVGKIPWRRKWQHTPLFLPGKSHKQRSLTGYSSWFFERVKHDWVTKQQQQQIFLRLCKSIGIRKSFLTDLNGALSIQDRVASNGMQRCIQCGLGLKKVSVLKECRGWCMNSSVTAISIKFFCK